MLVQMLYHVGRDVRHVRLVFRLELFLRPAPGVDVDLRFVLLTAAASPSGSLRFLGFGVESCWSLSRMILSSGGMTPNLVSEILSVRARSGAWDLESGRTFVVHKVLDDFV